MPRTSRGAGRNGRRSTNSEEKFRRAQRALAKGAATTDTGTDDPAADPAAALHEASHDARPGTEARRALRRDALLDAALTAIRRLGPGVSMAELAAEAGVTKPILYRHFGDREGLVAALGARFTADLMAELEKALLSPQTNPRRTVELTVDAFLAFLERDPDVYRLLVHRAVREQPAAAEALGGFLRQVGQNIALVLGEQLREAGADSGGAEVLAHGIVGLVHSAGDWWLENRTMPRARLVAYVSDLLWGGLASMGLGPTDTPTEENA